MKFKGAKPGDIVAIETKVERGYALVADVTDRGLDYLPIGGEWNKTRLHRDPATARQIKGVWRKLAAA